MSPSEVVTLAREAMTVALVIAAPILAAGLAVGVVTGVLQAMTQVNEMTLSFIPKLLAVGLVIMLAGSWMLARLMDFTSALMAGLPAMAR